MFLQYFTEPETLNYNMKDIFNTKMVAMIIPVMHYTSIITIIFSLILISVIIFKTPKQMKFFKTYLLPYVFNTLFLEIVMLIFKPLLLHPFFALVSLEMPQTASPKTLLILFIFMAYFAMSLVDCIASMAAERYYALSDLNSRHNKKPLIIFGILSLLTFCFLIFSIMLIYIDPIRHSFIMSSSEAQEFLATHLKEYSQIFNIKSILVFRTDISLSNFTIGFTLFVVFVFSRYIIAIIFFCLSAWKSHSSTSEMSRALRKHNSMLLRCTYAQFGGFCIFAGIPAIIIVLIYYFISEPSKIIYLCFLLMNMFGLFDILVTVICIKPYRNFFMDLFHFEHCTKVSPQTRYRLKSININVLH